VLSLIALMAVSTASLYREARVRAESCCGPLSTCDRNGKKAEVTGQAECFKGECMARDDIGDEPQPILSITD
jgi:hypothetical protein